MSGLSTYKKNGGRLIRIDAADGLVYNPNTHSGSRIIITDAYYLGQLEIDVSKMGNGEEFSIFLPSVLYVIIANKTSYPDHVNTSGIVTVTCIDDTIYMSPVYDADLESAKAAFAIPQFRDKVAAVESRDDDLWEVLTNKILINPILNDQGVGASVLIDTVDTEECAHLVAKVFGDDGNDLTLTIVEAGVNTPLSVEVDGDDIVVNLETNENEEGITTLAELRTLLEADTDVMALVYFSYLITGHENEKVAPLEETSLSGGALGSKLSLTSTMLNATYTAYITSTQAVEIDLGDELDKDYQITSSDGINVVVDNYTTPHNVILPAATAGLRILVKNLAAETLTVDVHDDATETVDGDVDYDIPTTEARTFICYDTNKWIAV